MKERSQMLGGLLRGQERTEKSKCDSGGTRYTEGEKVDKVTGLKIQIFILILIWIKLSTSSVHAYVTDIMLFDPLFVKVPEQKCCKDLEFI